MKQRGSITLVLLSYNEQEALSKLIPPIPFTLFNQVFAIDGGSTDGTLKVYATYGIPYFVQPVPGRGNAFLLALEKVTTEYIVFLSADGNENPDDLPTISAYLNEGYDLVIGGRFLLPGSASDDSDDPLCIRRWGNIGYSAIVRMLWKSGVRDAINGYRGFRVESMKRLKLDASWHEIELQSTIRAAKLGMRIKEFPTQELLRLGGQRKASAGTLILGWKLGCLLLREILRGRQFETKRTAMR